MTTQTLQHKISKDKLREYRGQLLDWYDSHDREVPWRVKSGVAADPYKVWLSEIMCQQTTVQAVKAYYTKFLERWPTIQDLANAPSEDVMAAWAGLGYYARARNLHKCAQIVANEMDGIFPKTQEGLKALPGIGDYTSAAIAAIAYNHPVTVVDGNIERVMARFFAITEPLPHSKKTLKNCASLFFTDFDDRPGDLAQAFMDLGAAVCIPKAPRCSLCPLKEGCEGLKQNIAVGLPAKIKGKARPQKYGHIYWVQNGQGQVLFHTRPQKGLLGGMVGLPTSAWEKSPPKQGEIFERTATLNQQVTHTFTHFDLDLTLHIARLAEDKIPDDYFWAEPQKHEDALPSVFLKAYKLLI